MKQYLIFFFCILYSSICFSQGDISETEKIYIKNESTFGLTLNTSGFGINYRYGKRVDAFSKKLYEFDIALVSHPKEIKIYNPIADNQKRFVFGKLNEVLSVKFGYGRQKEIYSKFDKGSLSIKYLYSFGGSLMLLKPIYYEMIDSTYQDPINNIYIYYVGTHKFNPSVHKGADVIGKAPFKLGFDEISVVPGVYAKAGLSFEYSNNDTLIRALEVGFCVEAYPSRIQLMAIDYNPQISLSLFLTYRFGRILDGRKKHKSEKKRFFFRKKHKDEVGVEEIKPVNTEEEYYEDE